MSFFNVPSAVPTGSSYVQLFPLTSAFTGSRSSTVMTTASGSASAFVSLTVPLITYLLSVISL